MNRPTHSPGEQSERSESPPLFSPTSKTSRPLPRNERDFHRELDRRLGLLRREIGSLKARARTVTRWSRTEYLKLLRALERRAESLELRVNRFVNGRGNTWESFRTEAEESWRDLKQMLEKVALSFRQRHPESDADPDEERPRR